MNEAETRAEHIDPALKAAGWGGAIREGHFLKVDWPAVGMAPLAV